MAARQCWCRVCQYLGAGAGMVECGLPQGGAHSDRRDGGLRLDRRQRLGHAPQLLPACGTPLFSEAEPRPHQIIVRVGALDDREAARPSDVIWTHSAPSWARIDPSLSRSQKSRRGSSGFSPSAEQPLNVGELQLDIGRPAVVALAAPGVASISRSSAFISSGLSLRPERTEWWQAIVASR